MPVTMPARRLRIAAAAVAVAALVAALFGGSVLRAVALVLIAEDPIEPAAAIVLTVDSGPAGVREAAALVRRGISDRVAVFGEAPRDDGSVDAATAERFERRLQQLASYGMGDVVVLPPVRGTTGEGPVLARWCREQGVPSIIVVSLPDHSRRVRRVMRRSFRDSGTRVMVKVAPYGFFEPETWWHHGTGIRILLQETAKLLADVVLHPVG